MSILLVGLQHHTPALSSHATGRLATIWSSILYLMTRADEGILLTGKGPLAALTSSSCTNTASGMSGVW